MRYVVTLAVLLVAPPALAREFKTHVVMGNYGFQNDYPQTIDFMLWPSRDLIATFQTGDYSIGVRQRVEITADNALNIAAGDKPKFDPRFGWSVFGDELIQTDYTERNWGRRQTAGNSPFRLREQSKLSGGCRKLHRSGI